MILAYFLGIRVPYVYNYSFLIKMALQPCKTKYSIRQRLQLTQTLTHCKAAARSWCGCREIVEPSDDCSISVPFYRHCTGTVRQPCDSRVGPYDYRKNLRSSCDFLLKKIPAKTLRSPHDRRTAAVRCPFHISLAAAVHLSAKTNF